MDESVNEGSETIPMSPQEAPTVPQAQVVPEPIPVESAPVAPVAAPAGRSGFTISHRALLIGGGVVLALILLALSFGSGVAVGRRMDVAFGRDGGRMMLQAPNSGMDGWSGRGSRGWDDDSNGYGNQNGSQNWHGGQGFRGMPRGQLPTGTPSP